MSVALTDTIFPEERYSEMRVKISADSTCDLSPEQIRAHDIGIVPLYVVKDGVSYRDGVDITPKNIYEHFDSGKGICSTAAVSVGDYIDYFGEILQSYDAVVHLTICSDMSSCYQNAMQAAEEFPGRVFPVDARNLSSGIGLLALMGCDLAADGMDAAGIAEVLTEKREKLDVSFVLSTLNYLHKGGRCSGIAALGANLLQLKPCVEVVSGKMQVGKKYRGNLLKCQLAYVRDRLAGRDDLDYKRIFFTNTALDEESVRTIRDAVAETGPWEEILLAEAGSTIACHCGPQCMGVLYFHK